MADSDRLAALETWRDGHNLDQIAADVVRIKRAIDGDATIRAQGLLDRLDRLQATVDRMEQNERDRAKQLEGMSLIIKIMAGATGAIAIPQLWQLIEAIIR